MSLPDRKLCRYAVRKEGAMPSWVPAEILGVVVVIIIILRRPRLVGILDFPRG